MKIPDVVEDSVKLSHLNFVTSLKNRIREVLDPLLPSNVPVALLDFPNYANLGDSLIWLGERAYLKERRIKAIYTAGRFTYEKKSGLRNA